MREARLNKNNQKISLGRVFGSVSPLYLRDFRQNNIDSVHCWVWSFLLAVAVGFCLGVFLNSCHLEVSGDFLGRLPPFLVGLCLWKP